MAKTKKQQAPTSPRGLDKGRIDLAMEAAGQIQVLSNQLLHHINDGDHEEMDSWESAIFIRALAARCWSLAGSTFTLLNTDDKFVRREDLEKIEKMVSHG